VKREPEFFGDKELALVYIAKRLRDALRLEEVLTAAGLDYAVETDTYRGGMIFVSERVGAFFYVEPENETEARELMRTKRFRPAGE
jgi:hypothetical protein